MQQQQQHHHPSPSSSSTTSTMDTSTPLDPKTYELTALNVSYSKPSTSTPILHGVSLTALPSQLLAIVGPSGAGKSTLLDILSTRTSPSSGALLLNSLPLRPSSFRRLSSHLPQVDPLPSLPLLTVHEAFSFTSSLLRSPLPVPSLLLDLRLSHLSHVPLSGPLSGGERRRVSLGLALLRDPHVLLLDEPTSGLDSSSALLVMTTLQHLARNRGRTVVLTIHQPSFKILDTVDSILLLHHGSVLHHGSLSSLHSFLHSHHLPVPHQLNALEYAMEVADQLLELKPAKPASDLASFTILYPPPDDPSRDLQYRSSRRQEIAALFFRFCKIVYRTRQLLLTNSMEALGVGLVLGTIYIHVGFDKQGMDKRLGLFAFTLTFLLSSTTESLPIFVNERPVLIRETSTGVYRLSSHLIASTLVFLPYLFVLAFLYSASVYFIVGLCGTWQAFSYFVLVTWAVVLMANSFVLFLSSLAPNYIAGTSLVTVSLAAFFLFSGYFLAKDSMPRFWVFMHYFSLYKYGLDAMLVNEYWCSRSKCFEWYEEGRACAVTGGDVLERRGLREGQRWTNVQIMLGYFLLYRVLYWAVLARRASIRKK